MKIKKIIGNNRKEILFVLVCFVLYFSWSLIIPFNNAPDEGMRYDIPFFIFSHGQLPQGNEAELIDPIWGQSYAYYPILSYILSAFLMKLVSFFTISDHILILSARFAGVIFSTLTSVFVLLISKKIFNKSLSVFFFASLVCFLPQFVFSTSFVNNDPLAIFSTALIIYSWILCIETKWAVKSCFYLSLGLSFCLLSYYNAYGYIICSITLFFISFYYQKSLTPKKHFIKCFFLVCFLCFFLTGWWFIRNGFNNNGDFLGLITTNNLAEQFALPEFKPSLHKTPQNSGYSILEMIFTPYDGGIWIKSTFTSFIGNFGSMTMPLPFWIYKIAKLVYAIGLISFMIFFFKNKMYKQKKYSIPLLVILFVFLLSILFPFFISVYFSYTTDYQPQGRYIMPMLIPIMLFISFGISKLNEYIYQKTQKNIMYLFYLFPIISIVYSTVMVSFFYL